MYAGELEGVADLLGCLHAAEEGGGNYTRDGLCMCESVCVHHVLHIIYDRVHTQHCRVS